MRDSVGSRLGYDPFDPGAARSLKVVVRRSGATLQAQIQIFDATGRPQGERQLEASNADCVELAATMAIAVSLGIDPLAATAPPPPPSPAPSPPPVPTSPSGERVAAVVRETPAAAPPSAPQPAPAPAPGTALEPRFSASGTVAFGVAPTTAWGAAVAAGLHGRLAEEREWLAVQALMLTGARGEARQRAAHFRESFPHSLMLPALDQVLAPPAASPP